MGKVTEGITKLRGVHLLWGEATRAFLCMIHILIALVLGQSSLIVPLGQGGFFYCAIPLPQARGPRLLVASLLTAVGLGFYLMGGNVVFKPLLSAVFTFFVAFNIGLLSGFNIMGMLAIHFISI
jgi:hypothetical protein